MDGLVFFGSCVCVCVAMARVVVVVPLFLGRGWKVFALGMSWVGWVGGVKGMDGAERRTGYWSGNGIPHSFWRHARFWGIGVKKAGRQVQGLAGTLVGLRGYVVGWLLMNWTRFDKGGRSVMGGIGGRHHHDVYDMIECDMVSMWYAMRHRPVFFLIFLFCPSVFFCLYGRLGGLVVLVG
jgi:hypothetical protein